MILEDIGFVIVTKNGFLTGDGHLSTDVRDADMFGSEKVANKFIKNHLCETDGCRVMQLTITYTLQEPKMEVGYGNI